MKLYCGTSGFSFKEWKGTFYPEELAAKDMLAFYARQLPTVEINNTFYRMPKRNVIEGWAGQVPNNFRFAVKASRRITHFKQLADCEEEARYLFDLLGALGKLLGVVLFQLPPHARADVDRLNSFLELVPEGVPTAFEFRHVSWRDVAIEEALARHRAAWVIADDDGDAPPELPRTAPLTYLRLRAESYSDEELQAWKLRCSSFEKAFVFFKHEGGNGPAAATRMLEL
jgi:uncharacterized protein YecE (DUF72 family)